MKAERQCCCSCLSGVETEDALTVHRATWQTLCVLVTKLILVRFYITCPVYITSRFLGSFVPRLQTALVTQMRPRVESCVGNSSSEHSCACALAFGTATEPCHTACHAAAGELGVL